jgi:clan AA aspartic protease
MIRGSVNSHREAVVSLRLRGPSGSEVVIPAAVDTGYNGSLTLSRALVGTLGLALQSSSQAELADGTVLQFDVYEAEVEWGNHWRTVIVSEVGDEALLGMRLLMDHELKIAVIPGGDVTIIPLP